MLIFSISMPVKFFNFIFDVADKVVCNCTDIYSISNNNMEIQADLVFVGDIYTDTMFQAIFAKQFDKAVLSR